MEKINLTNLRKLIDKEALKEVKKDLKNKYGMNYRLGFDIEQSNDDGYKLIDLNINIYSYDDSYIDGNTILTVEEYDDKEEEKIIMLIEKIAKKIVE